MQPFFFILILTFLFRSAYGQEQSLPESANSHTLVAEKVKSWQSAATPSVFSTYVTLSSNGEKQMLAWENNPNKSIDFYHWEHDSLTYSVNLGKIALKKNARMHGFYIASPDSVYVLDASNSKLHLLNKEGKLLKTHSWADKGSNSKKTEQLMARIYSGSAGIRQGDWLYISGVPFSGATDPATFREGRLSLAVNLKTGETRSDYAYPELYTDGKYAHYYLDISRCLTPEGHFLYSFGAEDSVRLTNLKSRDKAFYAGSSHFKTPPPAVPEMGNPKKPQTYGGILFDPKQQVYYRMAHHGLPDVFNAEYGFDEQELSIIILDKNFQKIGEKRLPQGKHNFRQWFVGPDGLYISNLHPSQESTFGQEISFTHYKLVPTDSVRGN